MREAAYVLAQLRATRTGPAALAAVPGVELAATAAGRRLVPVVGPMGRAEVALGWADLAEPDPEASDLVVQRLAPSALTTFAACLGLCWPDVTTEPYPGVASTVGAVLGVATRLGVNEIWSKAALLHDLPTRGSSSSRAAGTGHPFGSGPPSQLGRRDSSRCCGASTIASPRSKAVQDDGCLPADGRRAPARALVLEAVAALENAAEPVDSARFPALDDPGLRALVGEALAEVGRVVLRLPGGYVSGYDDEIADRLAAEGIGVLDPIDGAVLAVVLLRGVAVPRAAAASRASNGSMPSR